MQIFSINNQENKVKLFSNKNHALSLIAFEGGLTRLAQKKPTISSGLFQAANEIYKRDNGIVGIFPHEFVQAIKRNLGEGCNPQRIKKYVEGTRRTFAEAVKIFESIENNYNINSQMHIQKFDFNKLIKLELHNFKCRFYTSRKLSKLKLNRDSSELPMQLLDSAKIITNGFKKYGILTEGSKVIVQKLNEGRYGSAYLLSFYDKYNNKIFRDKVIKYYKNLEKRNEIRRDYQLKRMDIYNEEINKYILKALSVFKFLSNDRLNKILESRKSKYMIQRKIQKEKITKEIQEELFLRIATNGIYRETNIGNYLQVALGHKLKKSDLVSYFYTDFNNNYALSDFSSYENLGPVTKKNDFLALGLEQKDILLKSKYTNIINGRLVDYGGFEIINKALAENPVARRIYKKLKHINGKEPEKIVQQRIDKFNALWKRAKTNKLPQSSDILIGLEEARNLIPENKQVLLFN